MELPSEISSPKSVESSSNSKFKTLKKKIRNKFRLSRAEDVKTISQAVEILKKSDELLAVPNNNDSELLKNEFKGIFIHVPLCKLFMFYPFLELKETLESILSQNQTLSEVVKTVDSTCPDPFLDPEKFSMYFAQKTLSSRSISEDFESDNNETNETNETKATKATKATNETSEIKETNPVMESSVDIENVVLKLQNIRMEEQRSFQIERENYETRLGQLALLQQEIEILRKLNAEHEIQLEFLKSQKPTTTFDNDELENLKAEIELSKEAHCSEMSAMKCEIEKFTLQIEEKDKEIVKLNENIEILKNDLDALKMEKEKENKTDETTIENEELKQTNSQLHAQLEEALLQLKTLQDKLEGQEEKEREFREISEENVRIKIEFNELQKKLNETELQLADLEVKDKFSCSFVFLIL